MSYKNLVKYQEKVVRLLQNSYNRNRFVHTYLFVGAKGSLKKEAAYYLSSLILSKDGTCEECKTYREDLEKPNPYVFFISPEGASIKKDQIMNLEHEFSMSSSHERIFIIEHIDKATLASANSLLKFLEEAGERCYGILLTENLNRVLPTIISRSQVVKFVPLNHDNVYSELNEIGVENQLAIAISQLTSDFEEAIEYSKDDNIIQIVEYSQTLLSYIESDRDLILTLATEGKFLLSSFNKKYFEYFIDLLIIMQNDKIKYLLNVEKDLVFFDYIKSLNITIPLETQLQILHIIMEIKEKMRYNINTELAFVNMLVKIMRCKNG